MLTNVDIILTTVDNKILANKLAETLIQENIASCVQVDVIQSFYKWDNKLENREEYRLMIKAKSTNYQKIEHVILSLHNDSTPQIITINVSGGFSDYLNWVTKS